MVVLWCSKCGALMGVREPLNDWATECGVCPACLRDLSNQLSPPATPAQDAKAAGESAAA